MRAKSTITNSDRIENNLLDQKIVEFFYSLDKEQAEEYNPPYFANQVVDNVRQV